GYVEFTKPVDIGTGDLHKHDYFVKKRYYRNGIPDTLKVLSNGKKNYVYASRYLGYEHIRYLGGSREDEMFFYCFHMKYRASLRVEERLTTIDRLLCELEKVETEVRELFKRYKGLLSSSWIKERKNDDEWLKKTLNTTLQNQSKYRDVCFIEEKQRILRQDAEIKLYQDWQSKVCNAQIVTTSDILSGKNVDKNKSYFLFGRYDSWFDLSPHEDFLQKILAEETKEAKLALERGSLCPFSIRKLIPKLPEYIKELEVMSKNCEKFPKCDGLFFGMAKNVEVSTTSPDTICTTEEGKAFLLKILGAKIAELKKHKEIDENRFENDLKTFRNTSQIIIENNFEDIKRYVKQLLTERDKDIKNAKSKNDSECIYDSKFAEIDKVPYYRYKDKFLILVAIIKSNAEKLRSLNRGAMEVLRPVLLKKIDEVFVPLKKS
ncbi:MAG: hypothetical protein IJ599_02355, partial [Alphaproteobacteria bacterium]|nr:hypothetical protein [Alphaproteobacteria bacterium]